MDIQSRYEFHLLLEKIDARTGVELGVGSGHFSRHLLDTYPKFKLLYGIDRYAGGDAEDVNLPLDEYNGHGRQESLGTAKKLSSQDNYIFLRSLFTSAVELFEDGFFDFIFIDGYAHEGQDNGKTLTEWWPKIRSGGIFAGRAYDSHYPKCIKIVDGFVKEHNLQLNVLLEPLGTGIHRLKFLSEIVPMKPKHDQVQNWYIIKP